MIDPRPLEFISRPDLDTDIECPNRRLFNGRESLGW